MLKSIIYLIGLLIILLLTYFIYHFFIEIIIKKFLGKIFGISEDKVTLKYDYNENEKIYFKKSYIMTQAEYNFYNKIKVLENKYNIVPQINLAAVIEKRVPNKKRVFYNDLFHNIDFAIFNNNYTKLLLLIELNDQTHNRPDRKKRDENVKNICNEAGIKLITFYTNKPNDSEYVISRINNEISNNIE